jgi:hypothetical protein
MIFISHRGNVDGKDLSLENSPNYINLAIEKGFDVEVDVWYNSKQGWFLGHDYPQYSVNDNFFTNEKLWCHAKNLQAFEALLKVGVHCFWHQEDDYTLTSKGIIWAYPGKAVTENSICVMPERFNSDIDPNCLGICSDTVEHYRKKYGS